MGAQQSIEHSERQDSGGESVPGTATSTYHVPGSFPEPLASPRPLLTFYAPTTITQLCMPRPRRITRYEIARISALADSLAERAEAAEEERTWRREGERLARIPESDGEFTSPLLHRHKQGEREKDIFEQALEEMDRIMEGYEGWDKTAIRGQAENFIGEEVLMSPDAAASSFSQQTNGQPLVDVEAWMDDVPAERMMGDPYDDRADSTTLGALSDVSVRAEDVARGTSQCSDRRWYFTLSERSSSIHPPSIVYGAGVSLPIESGTDSEAGRSEREQASVIAFKVFSSMLDVEGLLADPGLEFSNHDIIKGRAHFFKLEPHPPTENCGCYHCEVNLEFPVRVDKHDYSKWCYCFDCENFRAGDRRWEWSLDGLGKVQWRTVEAGDEDDEMDDESVVNRFLEELNLVV